MAPHLSKYRSLAYHKHTHSPVLVVKHSAAFEQRCLTVHLDATINMLLEVFHLTVSLVLDAVCDS